MSYTTDPRVDAYIDALPDWQQAICREVRDLVHATDPEVTETIKFRDRPYFVLRGNICALLAAKTHVNVFLYDGAIVPDPEGIITGGHHNQTARTVAIRQGRSLNVPALQAMFRQIIANNRAGGWRKLKDAGRRATEQRPQRHQPATVELPAASGPLVQQHRPSVGLSQSDVLAQPHRAPSR